MARPTAPLEPWTQIVGKASPVHFFWGSFDLAVPASPDGLRRGAPAACPGSPTRSREAHSHEVSSAGFWPGDDAFPRAAFCSYTYPERGGWDRTALKCPLGAPAQVRRV